MAVQTKSRQWEKGFTAGYICAVAEIIRQHGEDVVARDVLRGNCPSNWRDIDEYDRETLRKSGVLAALHREQRKA